LTKEGRGRKNRKEGERERGDSSYSTKEKRESDIRMVIFMRGTNKMDEQGADGRKTTKIERGWRNFSVRCLPVHFYKEGEIRGRSNGLMRSANAIEKSRPGKGI